MIANEQKAGAPSTIGAAVSRGVRQVTWRQWAMVCVLTFLWIYAQIDGSSLILMVDPIKQDLGVTDTEMSLLLGLSFAAFFSILGLPAGYLVDRFPRRPIIGVGVVLWSSMTLSCGLAHTYWQLFLGRCGIGLGEAAITPASYSLIRDAFPPEKRGRAFGIFTAGSYIGAALAVMLTGALLSFFKGGRADALPVVAGLHPWQAVFVTIGTVGIPLALLVLTFREPARRGEGAGDAGVHFSEAFAHIRSLLATYGALILFITCFSGLAISYGSWMPTIISRTWRLPPAEIGIFFGGCLLICAPIGAWCGGHAIDALTRRGRRDAAEVVGIWITVIFIPFGVAAPIVPTVGEMFFALAAQLLVAGAYNPVAASILARMTPQRLMGKVTAVYILVYTLIGRSLGPLLVAWISDEFFAGPQALGFALGSAAVFCMAVALGAIIWLYRRAQREPSTPIEATAT
jgi:MFS family permease